MSGTTISGLLPVGLTLEGQVRQKFTLRLARVGDTLQAREAFPTDDLRFRLHHISLRLSLEGVSRPLTVADIEQLFDVDLAAVQEADEALEKKHLPKSGR
jgi:hypothetical protein